MDVSGRDLDGGEFSLGVVDGRWAEPDGTGLLDLRDLWCAPGLVDAHAHLSADGLDLGPADIGGVTERAFAALEGGVFLCIDKGWSDDVVIAIRDERSEQFPGIQAAGTMIAPPGGYYPGFGHEVGEEDLASVVAAQASRGGGWVKIVGDWPRRGQGALPNYTEEALAGAVRVAHAGGARVAIHTMAEEVPGMAVRAGVDSIEHGLFLAEPDLEDLAGRGGAWVPTVLRTQEILWGMRPGSSGADILGRGLERVRASLPVAAELGLDVLSGTDLAVPTFAVGREAAALAGAGLPVASAIAGLTTGGLSANGLPSGFLPGLSADVVAFDSEPRSDMSVLERPRLVLHRGRLLVDRR